MKECAMERQSETQRELNINFERDKTKTETKTQIWQETETIGTRIHYHSISKSSFPSTLCVPDRGGKDYTKKMAPNTDNIYLTIMIAAYGCVYIWWASMNETEQTSSHIQPLLTSMFLKSI